MGNDDYKPGLGHYAPDVTEGSIQFKKDSITISTENTHHIVGNSRNMFLTVYGYIKEFDKNGTRLTPEQIVKLESHYNNTAIGEGYDLFYFGIPTSLKPGEKLQINTGICIDTGDPLKIGLIVLPPDLGGVTVVTLGEDKEVIFNLINTRNRHERFSNFRIADGSIVGKLHVIQLFNVGTAFSP